MRSTVGTSTDINTRTTTLDTKKHSRRTPSFNPPMLKKMKKRKPKGNKSLESNSIMGYEKWGKRAQGERLNQFYRFISIHIHVVNMKAGIPHTPIQLRYGSMGEPSRQGSHQHINDTKTKK